MKRILCVCLLFLMIVPFMTSCAGGGNGGSSAPSAPVEKSPVEKVEEEIENLGTVWDSSKETKTKLENAEKAYKALSESEKAEVSNYDMLKKARKRYTYYFLVENASKKAESDLSANLKNPNSLQIHDCDVTVCYDSVNQKPLAAEVSIDYSAQNGLGGYNRNTITSIYAAREDGYITKSITLNKLLDLYNNNNGKYIFSVSGLD